VSGYAGHAPVKCALSTLRDFRFTTQHFWGLSLHRPALFGIFTLPSGIIRNSHFTAHWTEKGRFPTLQLLSKTKLSEQVRQKNIYNTYSGKDRQIRCVKTVSDFV